MARQITRKEKEIAKQMLWGVVGPTEAAKKLGVKSRLQAAYIFFRALKKLYEEGNITIK